MSKKRKKKKKSFVSKESIAREFAQNLLKRVTPSASAFKKILKSTGIRFMSEKIVYKEKSFYIVDFFIPDKNLCIELDGGYHNEPEQKAKDIIRDSYLISKGYSNWRLTNEEAVRLTKEQIIEKITSLPDKKRVVRQVAMREPILYTSKKKIKVYHPKSRKVKKTKPIKTEFPQLDKIAARKRERATKRCNLLL